MIGAAVERNGEYGPYSDIDWSPKTSNGEYPPPAGQFPLTIRYGVGSKVPRTGLAGITQAGAGGLPNNRRGTRESCAEQTVPIIKTRPKPATSEVKPLGILGRAFMGVLKEAYWRNPSISVGGSAGFLEEIYPMNRRRRPVWSV
jgi:hypothetical protein